MKSVFKRTNVSEQGILIVRLFYYKNNGFFHFGGIFRGVSVVLRLIRANKGKEKLVFFKEKKKEMLARGLELTTFFIQVQCSIDFATEGS